MSNAGQQTRGLSAGDWVRLSRLRASRSSGYSYGTIVGDLNSNADIHRVDPAQSRYGKALLIPYDGAGTTRILRPASKWTDYVASRTADFITQSQSTTNPNARVLRDTRLCDCSTTIQTPRVGLCRSCTVPTYAVTYAARTVYQGLNPAIRGLTIFRK